MKKKIDWVEEMAEPIRNPNAGSYLRGEYPELGALTVDEAIENLTGEIPYEPPPAHHNCRCEILPTPKPCESWLCWQLVYGLTLALVEVLIFIFGR